MPVETPSLFSDVIQDHLELKRQNAELEGDMPIDSYRVEDPFVNHPLFKTEEQARIARELHDGGLVGGLDGVEGSQVGHAGVAGRRVEGADLRITGEGGEQRVFAAAVAEHKGLHEPQAYAVALARPGPWPLRWSA